MFAPARCRAELGAACTPVAPGDTFAAAGFTVTAVDAHNTPAGRSTRKQHRPGHGVGYVLRAGDFALYHAGDTDVLDTMAALGPITWAFVPVGGTFTMDADEAAEAVARIAPDRAFPMHFRDRRDAERFRARVEAAGHACTVLGIGEARTITRR